MFGYNKPEVFGIGCFLLLGTKKQNKKVGITNKIQTYHPKITENKTNNKVINGKATGGYKQKKSPDKRLKVKLIISFGDILFDMSINVFIQYYLF